MMENAGLQSANVARDLLLVNAALSELISAPFPCFTGKQAM
jgi:hypothetical protein